MAGGKQRWQWAEQVDAEDPDSGPCSPVYDETTRQYRSWSDWHEGMDVQRGQSRHRLDLGHGFMKHIVRPN
jgi:hypothetical protein